MRVSPVVLGLCLPIFAARAQHAPALDFSGVDAFMPVMARLLADQEPDSVQWRALFATPGYAALEARGAYRRAALENAMRFAFMPSRRASRDSVARSGGFTGRSMQHLAGVPAARDTLRAFRANLAASGVIDRARHAVAAFLPSRLADSVAPPPVALLFFLDDGRGYPAIVVADLLRLARTGVDTGYFAHEFFHYYRRRFAKAYPDPASRDAGVAELLAYPAEEGVADQLDKRRYVDATDAEFAAMMARPGAASYAPGYRAAYARSAEWMSMVSHALERGVAVPDSASAFARAMRDSIPDSGRALGAFMARTIDRTSGRCRACSRRRPINTDSGSRTMMRRRAPVAPFRAFHPRRGGSSRDFAVRDRRDSAERLPKAPLRHDFHPGRGDLLIARDLPPR